MGKQELEQELREVEARMEQVDKGSRAYRAGQIIKISIIYELQKLAETEQ